MYKTFKLIVKIILILKLTYKVNIIFKESLSTVSDLTALFTIDIDPCLRVKLDIILIMKTTKCVKYNESSDLNIFVL